MSDFSITKQEGRFEDLIANDNAQAGINVLSLMDKNEVDAVNDYCSNVSAALENEGKLNNSDDTSTSDCIDDCYDRDECDSLLSYNSEEMLTYSMGHQESQEEITSNLETGQIVLPETEINIQEHHVQLSTSGCVDDSVEENLIPFEIECPFTWDILKAEFTDKDNIEYLLSKLSKTSSNSWRNFNFKILLAYILGKKELYVEALKTLKECEKILEENAENAFFINIMDGLHHITNASKYHLCHMSGRRDEALGVSSDLASVEWLSSASQGAVWACKAYILSMFGDDAKMMALDAIKKAINLDPNEESRRGAWYYLAGRIYTKIRADDSRNTVPGKEEMDMYRRAAEKNPFPKHIIALACLSGEAAQGFRARSAFNRRKADVYEKISQGMIEKSLAECELSLKETARIALIMKKLPRSLHLSEAARNNMRSMLEKCHKNFDTMLHDIKGSNAEGNLAKNLEDIKDSAVILAKVMIDSDRNPVQMLDKVVQTLEDTSLSKYTVDIRIFLLLMKGEYFLYQRKSVITLIKAWVKAIELDPDSPVLLKYPTQIFRERKILNIYKETKEKVKSSMRSKNLTKKNMLFLKDVIKICDYGWRDK